MGSSLMRIREGVIDMNEAYSTDPVIQLNEVFPGDTNALDTLFG